MISVYRPPLSTKVEPVALAAAHTGVRAEWWTSDPADRRPVREVSGPGPVRVLVAGDEVVFDSPRGRVDARPRA